VEQKNCLGIYLADQQATVVCINDHLVKACFTVNATQTDDEPGPKILSHMIAQACVETQLEFSEVTVALDNTMFMQHSLRSEFTDPRKIAQTIKFDIEDVMAADATELAIAFDTILTDEHGSALNVFTTKRQTMAQTLADLQANKLDPVTVEPDVVCLSRFITNNIDAAWDLNPIYAVLSKKHGYLLVADENQKLTLARTFMISPAQPADTLLARQIPLTLASLKTATNPNCIKIVDSIGQIDTEALGQRLAMQVYTTDLAEAANITNDDLTDCASAVDFAIAYGATLSTRKKSTPINFRDDFMPYQGTKMILQNAIKAFSVSLVILMLAIGLYFQLSVMKTGWERKALRKKLAPDYTKAMLGAKMPQNVYKKLKDEKRKILAGSSGNFSRVGKETMVTKLTYVLEAINKCAKEVDLKIKSISMQEKVVIVGNTKSRQSSLKLFDTIKKHAQLTVLSSDYKPGEGGRDEFNLTIQTKNP